MGYTSSQSIIVAHAALGGILAMVIWPGGALVGRYLRKYYPAWVRLHYIINGLLGVPILVVVFALGTYHKKDDENNWTTVHYRLGLVLLILGLLQPIYGWIIHLDRMKAFAPHRGWRSIVRYGHPVVGVTILALGFAQIYTGIYQWHAPGQVPRGVLIAWGVLTALWSALWLGGLALIPAQWKQKMQQEASTDGVVAEKPRKGSQQTLTRPSVETTSGPLTHA